MIKKYEQLFFDLDHTLWDFETNSRLALEQTVNHLKIDSQIEDFDSFFEFYESINSKLWEAYRLQQIRKPELIKKRFEDTLAHFNLLEIDPIKMNDCYLNFMPLQKKLYPNVIETLQYLKEKGYKMHIITNGFTEVQHQKIKSSGLSPFFERVFTSEAVQFPKPDKRIFQHALKCCNSKKSKSIMIGDSWETDILGARTAGISQVLISKKYFSSIVPQKNERGTLKKDYFEKTTPKYSTYILKNITNLTKIL